MKNLIYILGLFTISASLFSSCDKDDDNEGNGETSFQYMTTSQKRLVSVTENNLTYYYDYDSFGRMIKSSKGDNTAIMDYKFDGNQFTAIYDFENGYYIFSTNGELNSKGFIQTENEDNYGKSLYSYDKEDHLISIKYTEEEEEEEVLFTWENGNVVKVVDKLDEEGNYRLIYTNDEVTTPIENKVSVNLCIITGRIGEMFAARALYGKGFKNLPVGRIDDRGDTLSYNWTLDAEGYPTKLTKKYQGSSYPNYYTFTWE